MRMGGGWVGGWKKEGGGVEREGTSNQHFSCLTKCIFN